MDSYVQIQGFEYNIYTRPLSNTFTKTTQEMPPILADRFELNKGDRIGRHSQYEVVKTLGEGTYGIVYLVRDHYDHTEKAAKVLKLYQNPPNARAGISQRFNREFECGQIKSPYLVHATDKGEIKGNPFFIMEYCRKGSVKKWVGKNPDFNSIENLAVSTLLGLDVLHKNGIIHRDLKPDNILLNDNNMAKLTDFGIAGFQNSRLTKVNLRGHARDIFGTYAFIAPEQANSRQAFKTMAPTADMWSLGVTLYEIICGNLPFGKLIHDADLGEYLRRASLGQYDPITKYRRNTPPRITNLIEGCLQKDHTARIESAQKALDILGYAGQKTMPLASNYQFDQDLFGFQIMHGEEPGRIYNLTRAIPHRSGIATLGWYDQGNPNNNIITIVEKQSAYVSRYHATIEKDASQKVWIIKDGQKRNKDGVLGWHGSRNGTFVNGKKIDPKSGGEVLQPNDIITIGDTTLKVVFNPQR